MRTSRICLALATLVVVPSLAGTAAAQCNPDYVSVAGRSITVSPTGVDDTANLRCAIGLGAAMGPGLQVKLDAGTFYTEQLAIVGFRGSIEGAGREATVVRTPEYALPVPNACLGGGPTAGTPCFLDALPSNDNPYPSLVTVAASDLTIADLSIKVVGGWGTTTYELIPGWNLKFIISVVQPLGPDVSLEIKRAEIDAGPPVEADFGTQTFFGGANSAISTAYVGQPPERTVTNTTLLVADSILRNPWNLCVFNSVKHSRLFFHRNLIIGGLSLSDVLDVELMLEGNDIQGRVQFWSGWGRTENSSLWFANNVFSSSEVGIVADAGVFKDAKCQAVNNDVSGVATPYVWNGNVCKVVADK